MSCLAAALIVICAITARAQVASWADGVALWQHAIAVAPDDERAYVCLGEALRDRGDLQEADVRYRQALTLAGSPVDRAFVENDLGIVLGQLGRGDEARASFVRAVQSNPRFAEAQVNLANSLAAAGRPSDAIDHYRAALSVTPDDADARLALGVALAATGREDLAESELRTATRLKPDSAEAHANLAALLVHHADQTDAIRELTAAIALAPTHADWHLDLALLLVHANRIAEAEQHLEEALSLAPNLVQAKQALNSLRGQGR